MDLMKLAAILSLSTGYGPREYTYRNTRSWDRDRFGHPIRPSVPQVQPLSLRTDAVHTFTAKPLTKRQKRRLRGRSK